MRTSRLLFPAALLLTASTVAAQVRPSVLGTVDANAPATLKLESRIDYIDRDHNITPISVAVRSTFALNLDTSSTSPMIFTGAGAVTHTVLDVSDFQKVLPPQCSVTLTANDGSLVARIHYTNGGDPVLDLGNLGSVLETLALGGLCAYGNPPTNLWGGPYTLLHEDEISGAGYYQFSIEGWTQLGPLAPDGPVTFFKDYSQSTSSLGNEPVVPLMPVNEARETTHIEFTINARSPVTVPTPTPRRRSVRH